MKAKIQSTRSAKEVLKDWLKEPYDQEMREEVKKLVKKHPDQVEEAFGGGLKFGTAGLRAPMGPGPGFMNKYTVQMATQGLANYIASFGEKAKKRGVAICHDCRMHSRFFAETAAMVLAGNGITVHIVKDLRPTPFLSFAVRHLHCISGINITASHNPKNYNGYKVYWEDGAQITAPHDQKIIDSVHQISSPKDVKIASLESSLIHTITEQTENAYFDALQKLSLRPKQNQEKGSTLKIRYSPLHGAGATMIPRALEQWGFTHVHMVEEQKNPDGHFPTTPYPNPETPKALELGIRDLKKHHEDLLLVSDPDSDRLSLTVLKNHQAIRLSGNQLGILFLDYLIHQKKPKGKWATVTTIVSSPLIPIMTKKYKGTCFEVLTGFKYIGQKIHEWEKQKGSYHFLFGMEESLGYLYGTHARDKDATIAALLAAEMTLFYKEKNQTLLERLEEIYQEFGYFHEEQRVIKCDPKTMHQKMQSLRKDDLKKIGTFHVKAIEDYKTGEKITLTTQRKEKLTLPKSDVLIFRLEGANIIVRPSGTEPKIKIYGGGWTKPNDQEPKHRTKIAEDLHRLFDEIEKKLS